MKRIAAKFLAPIPVGHRLRTFRAERRNELDDGNEVWLSSGCTLLRDLDTGIVYGPPSQVNGLRRAEGDPVPESPDLRLFPDFEGRVVWCFVASDGGDMTELETELGVEAERHAYR